MPWLLLSGDVYGHFQIIGYLGVNYKSSQYSYNAFGVGNLNEKNRDYASSYAGVGLRYQREWFIELEPRHYFNKNSNSFSVGVGMAFEF